MNASGKTLKQARRETTTIGVRRKCAGPDKKYKNKKEGSRKGKMKARLSSR
jgi:hypothetical protein